MLFRSLTSTSATVETESTKYLLSYNKENGILKELNCEVLIKVSNTEVNNIGTIKYMEGVVTTHIWDLTKLAGVVSEFNQIILLVSGK